MSDGGQVTGGQINITITNQAHDTAVAAILANPCALGHRFAYLNSGGIECVTCGARR